MRHRPALLVTSLLTLAACDVAPRAAAPAPVCGTATRSAILPDRLHEASGIAASRRSHGVLWAHNDHEGEPQLYALDESGRIIAEFAIDPAGRPDWEDIAIGPCPAGECIYIGDIGDNLHDRHDRAILRLAEPDIARGTAVNVERFPFRYADGPQDAEALFVLPDTSVYIISKGRNGPVTLHRYPPPLRQRETVTLEPVQRLTDGLQQLPDLVTGADATPDGEYVAVRTYTRLQFYRFDGDTLVALWPAVDLTPLAEPQGEGVAVRADGTVFLVSEVGPTAEPAPLSRLPCRLRRRHG